MSHTLPSKQSQESQFDESLTQPNPFQSLPNTLRGERYYYLAYDTPHDKLRKKLSQACLDAGLFRVQYSVFIGCIKDLKAQSLLQNLQHLAWLPLKPKDPTPAQPLARLLMLRLDQGQSWFGLASDSEAETLFTPLNQALRPKLISDYIFKSES